MSIIIANVSYVLDIRLMSGGKLLLMEATEDSASTNVPLLHLWQQTQIKSNLDGTSTAHAEKNQKNILIIDIDQTKQIRNLIEKIRTV